MSGCCEGGCEEDRAGVWKSDDEERYECVRKAGEERWKEKVGDDREGDKTTAFLSMSAASLLGLNNKTQAQNLDGFHQRSRFLTCTHMHIHSSCEDLN